MLGEEERSLEEGSFSKASIPKRIAIVLAGGLVNIIFGLIVYFILMASQGQYYTTTVDKTMDNYNAKEAGIIQNDKILEVNGKKVRFGTDIIEQIQLSNGEDVVLKISRNNDIKYITVKPVYENIETSENNNESVDNNDEKDESKIYRIGIAFKISDKNLKNSMYYAYWSTIDFSVLIFDNLKNLFTGKISTDQLVGPVGISKVVTKTEDAFEFIYLLALISLSLGITNLLPFPPLDGGKIVFLIIEAIRRKPLKEETETKIQLIGFALLIGLSIYVTYNDIFRTY